MRRHCGQGPPRDLDAQGDNAAPTVHALPTDPRAAGDGVSSRVSSTAARLARMASTALSIAASSGGRAARCCRSASNQSGHAAGRKTAIASAPLRATPSRRPTRRPARQHRGARLPRIRPQTTANRQFRAGHAGDQSHTSSVEALTFRRTPNPQSRADNDRESSVSAECSISWCGK